jgi:thioesterase domain-containing protein
MVDDGAVGFAVMRRLRSVYAAHVQAARRYHPGRFEGPLAVLGADPTPADPTLGFGSVAGGPLRVARVPGSHESLLEPPQVDLVAAELRSFFRALALP